MRSKHTGRPAVCQQQILNYVNRCGCARALEIRMSLAMSSSSFYSAVAVLVADGLLCWARSDVGNYRLLKTTKAQPASVDYLASLGY